MAKKNSLVGGAVLGKPVCGLGQLLESTMTCQNGVIGPLNGEQTLQNLTRWGKKLHLNNRGCLSVDRSKVVKIVIWSSKSYYPQWASKSQIEWELI